MTTRSEGTVQAPRELVCDVTERALIERVKSRLPPAPGWLAIGIGDDAAVIVPERNRLDVVTVDALVEHVHFDRRFTPPDAIGHRALAANLSDLAAMGAAPRWALLSMALPLTLSLNDFDAIVGRLADEAGRHKLHVAGGNLTRSPGPLVIDVTVGGTVKKRRALIRSGARPGDEIYVSGTIGAAAAGLEALRRDESGPPPCVRRYLYPEPRVRLGSLLARNSAATACMDLSDGLADGLTQIAEASGVGMSIDAAAVPIDRSARAWFEAHGKVALDEALSGGDDYELLFTSRPRHRGRLEPARREGTPLTRIGVCTVEPSLILCGSADAPLLAARSSGFRHFR